MKNKQANKIKQLKSLTRENIYLSKLRQGIKNFFGIFGEHVSLVSMFSRKRKHNYSLLTLSSLLLYQRKEPLLATVLV